MSGQPPDITRDLVASARAGDEAALRALIRGAYPLVRRWSLVHLGDVVEADDLTQDVIVQMIQKLERFDGTSRFQTWLYAVTRNAARDRLRARGRRARAELDPRTWEALLPDAPSDPSQVGEVTLLRQSLEAFLRDLPDRQREILDLVDLQGMSAAEAAELMGIEPTTVRVHLFRARRHLRTRILEVRPELAERNR